MARVGRALVTAAATVLVLVAAAVPSQAAAGGLHLTNATSSSYAGYETLPAGSALLPSEAKISYRVPKVTCPKTGNTNSTVWVGLADEAHHHVLRAGTSSSCAAGKANYSAWIEDFGLREAMPSGSFPVDAGDTFTAGATWDPSIAGANPDGCGFCLGAFTATLLDESQGNLIESGYSGDWTPRAALSVVEAPRSVTTHRILPLADFGSLTVYATKVSAVSYDPTGHRWVSAGSTQMILPSGPDVTTKFGWGLERYTMGTPQSGSVKAVVTPPGRLPNPAAYTATWLHS